MLCSASLVRLSSVSTAASYCRCCSSDLFLQLALSHLLGRYGPCSFAALATRRSYCFRPLCPPLSHSYPLLLALSSFSAFPCLRFDQSNLRSKQRRFDPLGESLSTSHCASATPTVRLARHSCNRAMENTRRVFRSSLHFTPLLCVTRPLQTAASDSQERLASLPRPVLLINIARRLFKTL